MAAEYPFLVMTIGLERYTAQALSADLHGAKIQQRRPLQPGSARRRPHPRPDLVILDMSSTRVAAELAAARTAWGEVVIVGVGRHQPIACVWPGAGAALLVEIGPGFLTPFVAMPSPAR